MALLTFKINYQANFYKIIFRCFSFMNFIFFFIEYSSRYLGTMGIMSNSET